MKLEIYVKPNSRRARVGGMYADRLIVSVNAPAVDGKANTAVIEAVAEALDVRKRSITIMSGLMSKRKTLGIVGDDKVLADRISTLRNSI